MDAQRQAQVAFYLTGRRLGTELEPVDGLGLRPALLAGYRDLGALRYGFPVVLVDADDVRASVRPLSGLIDEALAGIGSGPESERISRQALRLEQLLRESVGTNRERLSALWSAVAERLGAGEDAALREGLDRLRAALEVDGEVVDCDAAFPRRMFTCVWRIAQALKARALQNDIERNVHRLSEILRADFARSREGRSAASLRSSLGGSDAEAFDFDALSAVLVRSANRTTLADSRRQRLDELIHVLRRYELDAGSLCFTSCAQALDAWRERVSTLADVARALAMAELEIAGDYRDDHHDAFFEEFGADGLTPDEIARFPDYLVCVNAATMDASEQAALMEILAAGLPMKILVQTDDLMDDHRPETGRSGFGRSAVHFANMAIGLNEVYVLQAAASHLPCCMPHVQRGIEYRGATLFSVYSGSTGSTVDLPPYLVAAAAVESRAFPLFAYDPAAGTDWASRFSLNLNPQPDLDWPVHDLSYENAERRRVSEDTAFTFVDFAAMDERYARHLARMPVTHDESATVPVARVMAPTALDQDERVPCIMMVGADNRLQRVLVDERLLREASKCLDAWHSLQELGGIHNSHARRRLAEARETLAAELSSSEPVGPSAEDDATSPSVEDDGRGSSAVEPMPEAQAAGIDDNDPWIETPRCTTCNECTQINDKLFAYNENRQAYVADPDAGTYAQLIEAAESCQVSIIHPGKPRNPSEPGLEDLLRRAEAFM